MTDNIIHITVAFAFIGPQRAVIINPDPSTPNMYYVRITSGGVHHNVIMRIPSTDIYDYHRRRKFGTQYSGRKWMKSIAQ